MRRTVILASLAFPLLAVGALALIVSTTRSADVAPQEAAPRDSAALQTPVPAVATSRPALSSGSHSATTAVGASASRAPAAPDRTQHVRDARAARAAFLAAKLQQAPRSRPGPAPAARPARESLPPEEVAAMEARGMDWRGLERMMREGVPGVPAAPPVEEQPQQVQGDDESQ